MRITDGGFGSQIVKWSPGVVLKAECKSVVFGACEWFNKACSCRSSHRGT